MNILILDDQRSARRILCDILSKLPDVTVAESASLEEGRRVIASQPIDVALVDIRLGSGIDNQDGLTFVRELRERTSVIPIVISVSKEMSKIRAAMRLGAYDYILKDELCDELVRPIISALLGRSRVENELRALRAAPFIDPTSLGIVGVSPAIEQMRQRIRRVANSERPVLCRGRVTCDSYAT